MAKQLERRRYTYQRITIHLPRPPLGTFSRLKLIKLFQVLAPSLMSDFPISLLAFFGTIETSIAASTSHEPFCRPKAAKAETAADCQERERRDGGTIFQALFAVKTV
jgi:hypothetical protein